MSGETGSVWFLTGSQHLYGEEILRLVDEHARVIAGALDASGAIPVPVVHREPLTDPDAIGRALMRASAEEGCVGVIAWMHTFSPARMWIAGLSALRRPLLHLHTQFDRDLPWAEIDMDYMNLNQSAHGDREFGYLQTRIGVARKTVVGHWADPAVQARVGCWARAARGWDEAQRLKVARFGDNMRNVAVTEGDKVGAQIQLGVSVNGYGVDGLSAAVRDAPDSDVEQLLAEYEAQYELAPELRSGGARRDSLHQAGADRSGPSRHPAAGGSAPSPTPSRTAAVLRQLPGIAVSAPDGRRIRLWGRG